MGKRTRDGIGPTPLAKKKRKAEAEPEEITAAHGVRQISQLENAIQYHQGDVTRQLTGLKEIRKFLDSVDPVEGEPVPGSKETLIEFVNSEAFSIPEPLSGLIQAWRQAFQDNEDALLTEIPSTLTSLLRVGTSIIEVRSNILLLCRTLLVPTQARLIARGLGSPPKNDRLIGPCLRLLLGIISFDGGYFIADVFSSQNFTFKSFGRNLGLSKPLTGNIKKDRREPSLRTHAIRVFLALLKFSTGSLKSILLDMKPCISAIFRDFSHDPAGVLISLVITFREHVFLDKGFESGAKQKFCSNWILERLRHLTVWEKKTNGEPEDWSKLRSETYALLEVISSPTPNGILPSPGKSLAEYARKLTEVDPSRAIFMKYGNLSDEFLRLKLDSGTRIVEGAWIGSFMKELKPWSNSQNAVLILGVFKHNWCLVHRYFSIQDSSFHLNGKIDEAWMTKSAFLYKVVQLPAVVLSSNDTKDIPPHIVSSLLLETIIPRPFTKEVMISLLRKDSEVANIYAIQILAAALRKLDQICKALISAKSSSKSKNLSEMLRNSFIGRLPPLTDILHKFKTVSSDNLQYREAVTKLFSLYCQVLSDQISSSKIDLSGILEERIQTFAEQSLDENNSEIISKEIGCLLTLAIATPDMKWWQKSGSVSRSCFTNLLVIASSNVTTELRSTIASVFSQLVEDYYLFPGQQLSTSVSILLKTFADVGSLPNSTDVYQFFDRSLVKYVSRPTQYWDNWETLMQKMPEYAGRQKEHPRNPFSMALLEQWRYFLEKSHSLDTQRAIFGWIASFLAQSLELRYDDADVAQLHKAYYTSANLPKSAKDEFEEAVRASTGRQREAITVDGRQKHHVEVVEQDENTEESLSAPRSPGLELSSPEEPVDEPQNLLVWAQYGVQLTIQDGHAGRLIECLSSQTLAIRQQAFTNLTAFGNRVQESTYSEKGAISLLTNELLFTAQSIVAEKPLPFFLTEFATRAIVILSNPLHVLYSKINEFLHQGPKWSEMKVPMVKKILIEASAEDESQLEGNHSAQQGSLYMEHAWLIDYLTAGLKTIEDLTVYCRCGVFERVRPLYHVFVDLRPAISRFLQTAARIEGGDVMLIARTGLHSWIEMTRLTTGDEDTILEDLQNSLTMKLGDERLGRWRGEA